ncbi:MAG: hypothetical protein EOS73_09835 [Mesorhizobium sp.]|uniref:hypothetical protein n=1 Tax=Mesorhizobium sp. M7A.F.Ca.ET.027.02.1.1 TaxID=2496655 RepID=UPI000FD437A3|nr:hypothetical protein [Mesorhizobium sp. M7A.F.Ca.ET.027.02.1.1]RVD18150.1 hypothetical protein EN749_05975 [Mesorhizobium sp. M7A.F.Ca.ET.027.02.1.1]RWD09690.1 MAG: hypothetical protein EOS73_09835 [Mesorhizobium sp.]
MQPEPHHQSDAEQFVLETDQAPEFWQFLNGLHGDDLLVELIVNELDAKSPRTEIRFEADRLVCTGRGEPVDSEGWDRLRKLKGAGHTVKAKVGLFGIKNHGLKACFTLGDDVLVRSAGRQILQTLFANGHDRPAYPGVRIPPRDDPSAPSQGTQIEVAYRRKPFVAPHGEAITFPSIDDAHVDSIYREAVATLPQRLLGIVRPSILETYTLELTHHTLGSVTLSFRSSRPRREGGHIVFTRECLRSNGASETKVAAREQGVLSVWAPDGFEQKPRFFQANMYMLRSNPMFTNAGLVIEAAWNVDGSGRLRPATGKLRYPVGYPGDGTSASTGSAIHYSGPFVSDTERHELGPQSKAWNEALIAACDDLAATVLKDVVLPRHRATGLQLVAGLTDRTRLTSIVGKLLAARALPAIDRKGHPIAWPKKRRLVIPTYRSETSTWASALAHVCPSTSILLDSKTPGPIVGLLADGVCTGWKVDHLRFDEQHVLERISGPNGEWFPWASEREWRRILGQADVATAHLDALLPILTKAEQKNRASSQGIHLPDGQGSLHPFPKLKRGVSLPSGLMGVELPPVIHPDLRNHAVFRLEGWKLQNYAFRNMLAEGNLPERSLTIRRRFFDWITKHADEIVLADWPLLKALPIWPTTDGTLQLFESLCQPETELGRIFGEQLQRPSREVARLCKTAKKIPIRLRTEPNPDEISAYYKGQIASFPTDCPLTSSQQHEFGRFEAGLAVLSGSRRMAQALRSITADTLALDRTGRLRRTSELVRETWDVAHLKLMDDAIIVRSEISLDDLFPPLAKPTALMALNALREDGARTQNLLARLRVATAGSDPAIAAVLRMTPCIPVDSELYAAANLAFKGNAGDYWGEWKRVISAAGLPDDAQDLYRSAGVIKSLPDPDTSRAFFVWLNAQSPQTVGRHLDQVIRHLAHKQGVGAWRLQPPEVACIPVEAGSGIRLLTISEARRIALLNDFPALADEIRTAKPPFDRLLAIHSVQACSTPVADQLREWGIPPLSAVTKGPLSASGTQIALAPSGFLEVARMLTSNSAGRRFRKQLQELDVSQSLIEPQFQRRLAAIKKITIATGLRTEFRIARRTFHPRHHWAVLPEEIWLDAGANPDDLLMKAMADLIFVHPRPRYMPAILKAALTTSTRDYRGREDAQDFHEDHDESEDYKGSEDHSGSRDHSGSEDVAEATRRHPGGSPDLSRNQPKPGPLYTGSGGEKRERSDRLASSRPEVTAESVQRRELKAKHYAFHCQIELAKFSPEVLAPARSYVEFAENRSMLIEAHHPDKVSTNGLRHAGNLLILSRVNHELIGTQFSRVQIAAALQSAWVPQAICNPDGSIWLEGGVASVVNAISGKATKIYFTNEHRRYWLDMAGALEEPDAAKASSPTSP